MEKHIRFPNENSQKCKSQKAYNQYLFVRSFSTQLKSRIATIKIEVNFFGTLLAKNFGRF